MVIKMSHKITITTRTIAMLLGYTCYILSEVDRQPEFELVRVVTCLLLKMVFKLPQLAVKWVHCVARHTHHFLFGHNKMK